MILHYDNQKKINELKIGLDEAKLRLKLLKIDIDTMWQQLKDRQ